jgi:hypothetical protein
MRPACWLHGVGLSIALLDAAAPVATLSAAGASGKTSTGCSLHVVRSSMAIGAEQVAIRTVIAVVIVDAKVDGASMPSSP